MSKQVCQASTASIVPVHERCDYTQINRRCIHDGTNGFFHEVLFYSWGAEKNFSESDSIHILSHPAMVSESAECAQSPECALRASTRPELPQNP